MSCFGCFSSKAADAADVAAPEVVKKLSETPPASPKALPEPIETSIENVPTTNCTPSTVDDKWEVPAEESMPSNAPHHPGGDAFELSASSDGEEETEGGFVDTQEEQPQEIVDPLVLALIDQGEATMKKLVEVESSSEWTSIGQINGVDLELMPAGTLHADNRQIVRGRMCFGKIGAMTHQEFIDVLGKLEEKHLWDPQFENGHIVEDFPVPSGCRAKGIKINWSCIRRVATVSGRDFLYTSYYVNETDTRTVLACSSVTDDRYPEGHFSSNHVRGDLQLACFVIEDNEEDGKTYVSYVNQTDPCGYVPTWIVNSVQKKQPTVLGNLYKLINKDGRLDS